MQSFISYIKKVLLKIPIINSSVVWLYEKRGTFISLKKMYSEKVPKISILPNQHKKPRILFYHISGLSYGGTEKFLQILAKHINKNKFDVFFVYSSQPRNGGDLVDGRKEYLDSASIELVPFKYSSYEMLFPYHVSGMSPHIINVINDKEIDLVITAGSGYSEFPINILSPIPVIMLNIFGSPSSQSHIKKHVSISHEVDKKISRIVPQRKREVMYIPSEGPSSNSPESGKILRKQLGISEADIVFGRIGRGSDAIFDPIAIRAFQLVVKEYPHAHYVVMSAPPAMKKIVELESIPNVHFISASADEDDVWAFHQSIDVLAHSRLDGESCGLNIIESMLCGKPVISHRSHIWNAHLEYLDPSFSRIAEKDNIDQYANHMREFIDLHATNKLRELGAFAKQKADTLFLIQNNIQNFERWIDESIKRP